MSLKACVECGEPVSPHAPQCPRCGRRHPTVRSAGPDLPLLSATSPGMPAIRCRECGTPIRGRMSVCPVCGLKDPIARRSFPWRRIAIAAGAVLAVAIGWVGYEWWSSRSAEWTAGCRGPVCVIGVRSASRVASSQANGPATQWCIRSSASTSWVVSLSAAASRCGGAWSIMTVGPASR